MVLPRYSWTAGIEIKKTEIRIGSTFCNFTDIHRIFDAGNVQGEENIGCPTGDGILKVPLPLLRACVPVQGAPSSQLALGRPLRMIDMAIGHGSSKIRGCLIRGCAVRFEVGIGSRLRKLGFLAERKQLCRRFEAERQCLIINGLPTITFGRQGKFKVSQCYAMKMPQFAILKPGIRSAVWSFDLDHAATRPAQCCHRVIARR